MTESRSEKCFGGQSRVRGRESWSEEAELLFIEGGQKSENKRGGDPAARSGQTSSDKGNSKYKGPEAGTCLLWLRNSKETHIPLAVHGPVPKVNGAGFLGPVGIKLQCGRAALGILMASQASFGSTVSFSMCAFRSLGDLADVLSLPHGMGLQPPPSIPPSQAWP